MILVEREIEAKINWCKGSRWNAIKTRTLGKTVFEFDKEGEGKKKTILAKGSYMSSPLSSESLSSYWQYPARAYR
jgi:hypothetical protein